MSPTGHVGPYELIEEIGAGTTGRVYRAKDPRTGEQVAIKTLRPDASSDDLYGLKREFRLAGELASAHLVPIYDLFVDAGTAHIVMPLLRGQTLDRWAAAGSWRERPNVLFDVLGGVAAGLEDLHRAGLVHRDVKPHNVMIEPDDRVLLVDYGLATQRLSPDAFVTSSPGQVAGTLAFMSPECFAGAEAAPERDVFALGATIFFAVTGHAPPRRPGGWEVALDPARERFESAWPDAPQGLFVLVARALSSTPAGRDAISVIRRELARISGATLDERTPQPAVVDEALFGRETAHADLTRAIAEGHGVIAVSGPSGIGKSSLVSRVLADLRTPGTVALVLAGRCHPGEHLRYRTLDAALDELTRWLIRCGPSTQREIVPSDFATLQQAFPVLTRLGASDPSDAGAPIDPEEHRRRLGGALRALLAKVGAAWRTVVWIDDVQWADLDGVSLVADVIARLGTRGPVFVVSGQSIPPALASHARTSIALEPLPPSHARALLDARAAARSQRWDDTVSTALVDRARGNPALLRHLVDHVAHLDPSHAVPTLENALRFRLDQAATDVRDVARALSLATQPIPRAAALALAGADARRALNDLRTLGLLRVVPFRGVAAVEIPHDTLREAIASTFSTDEARALHRRLASALEDRSEVPSEIVADHWERAGERARARTHLLAAGEGAARALAFDHAARCYRRLLDLTDDQDERTHAHAELARALSRLGHGRDASREYVLAAEHAPPAEARPLREAAAIQLLHAGYVDEGLTSVRAVFRSLDVRVPTSGLALLVWLAFQRVWLAWRGISYRLTEAPTQPHAEIADAAYALTTALASSHTVLAMYTQTLHFSHALRSGTPLRVARALALESGFAALSGRRPERARELLGQAELVLGERHDPRARALFAVSRASSAWVQGRWDECIGTAREAERIARDECVGAWWELGLSRSVLQDSLRWAGRYGELDALAREYVADALRRGDRYARVTFGTRFVCSGELVAGRVSEAWAACAGEDAWGARGVHLQHLAEIHARAECLLYAGQAEEALALVARAVRRLRFSPLIAMPAPRAKLLHLQASCRLAHARSTEARRRSTMRAAASDLVRVRAAGWDYAAFLADLGDLTLRSLEGADVSADLEALARRAEALGMPQYAAAIAFILAPDAPPTGLRALGVAEPERWAAVLLPGLAAPVSRRNLA